MRYWDTSVLLKLFVKEDDSGLFAALIEEPGEVIHTSELSRLELLRGLWGKRLDGLIVPGQRVRGGSKTLLQPGETHPRAHARCVTLGIGSRSSGQGNHLHRRTDERGSQRASVRHSPS